MNRCRKCGRHIERKKLRCKICRLWVNAELEGRANNPLGFYFDYYWKYEYRKNH